MYSKILVKLINEFPIESQIIVNIAPINFLLTVLVFGIVVYLICVIIEKRNEKDDENRRNDVRTLRSPR